MWWNDYWHGPWMFFGPFMMLVFIAVCMGLMYFAMRGHVRGSERAIDILKGRFARGEITQAEFEERRRVLDA
jgi:uncharacterized membrane protein